MTIYPYKIVATNIYSNTSAFCTYQKIKKENTHYNTKDDPYRIGNNREGNWIHFSAIISQTKNRNIWVSYSKGKNLQESNDGVFERSILKEKRKIIMI